MWGLKGHLAQTTPSWHLLGHLHWQKAHFPKTDHSTCWHLCMSESFFLRFKQNLFPFSTSILALYLPLRLHTTNLNTSFLYPIRYLNPITSVYWSQCHEQNHRQKLLRWTFQILKEEYNVAFPALRGLMK